MISEEAEVTEDSDHHGDTEARSRAVPVRPACPFRSFSPRLRVSAVNRCLRSLG